MSNKVNYLILSSMLDFSTDLICYEMRQRGLDYVRINRDCFSNYLLKYDVTEHKLTILMHETEYTVTSDELKAVFFRAPVFLRTNKAYSVEQQLYRSQWSSFIRNLTVFSRARWLNHPMNTYQAENKVYQLDVAKNVGMRIPKTVITNDVTCLSSNQDSNFVIKALDTPLFYDNGQEMFTYTSVVNKNEVGSISLVQAPVILQEYLKNKIDIRVTVVGKKIFPVAIMQNSRGIDGDWRKRKKDELQFIPIEIPVSVKEKLLKLMNAMHLSFGGIDLAYVEGMYYFIEVNPTGEWGWLVNTAGLSIHKAIVDWLVGANVEDV